VDSDHYLYVVRTTVCISNALSGNTVLLHCEQRKDAISLRQEWKEL
jgi:hypothetical protein